LKTEPKELQLALMEEQKNGCSEEEDGENDVGDLIEHANRELVNARPSNLEIDTQQKIVQAVLIHQLL